jgi:hypothetical protein
MFGKGCLCRDISHRKEAGQLLDLLREHVPDQLAAKKLCPMGKDAWKHEGLVDGYSCKEGEFIAGQTEPRAHIPFLVEAWAATREPSGEEDSDLLIGLREVTINRSPAITEYSARRHSRNRSASVTVGGAFCPLDIPKGSFEFAVNITSPYLHLLGDNKNPSLSPFSQEIAKAVEVAIQKAARNNPPTLCPRGSDDEADPTVKAIKVTQKAAVLKVLPDAVSRSGAGGYQFSQRGLFYRVRELMKRILPGVELQYQNFTGIITDYEAENGDIPGLIRDARGVFVEPHGGEMIALGTVSVSEYERPSWKYSNILFIEKVDLVSILRQAGFLDRWDCFPISSQGFGTRAAKDLIDKIGECRDEPMKFFCVHDADASGTLISQTLSAETRSRGMRNVEIIDLGLFPWKARQDRLPAENVGPPKRRKAVADYVTERDELNEIGNLHDEPNWEEWLQTHRVELNAMTSEQFVKWMDKQFTEHGAVKVLPPERVAKSTLIVFAEAQVRNIITARIMEEVRARIDSEAAAAIEKLKYPEASEIVESIQKDYEMVSQAYWRDTISGLAKELAEVALAN